MIIEINGSLVDAKEDVIAHGCNCVGGFSSGIAKYIAEKFPESKDAYVEVCSKKDFKLGDVQIVQSKGKYIANCATQYNYGKYLGMDEKSIIKRYQAIENCLKALYEFAKQNNLSVAIPRLGCGRARGDWNIVRQIVSAVFHDYPITVYFIPDEYTKK